MRALPFSDSISQSGKLGDKLERLIGRASVRRLEIDQALCDN